VRPLVLAYHLIWTIYGYWLPNDPRGSTSRTIRNDILKDLGQIHFGRKRIQPTHREIKTFHDKAQNLLKQPVRILNPNEIQQVGSAFAELICAKKYTVYACAIMSDHVHLIIRKHRDLAEEMIANLQRAAYLRLCKSQMRDQAARLWGGHGWKVFLDHPDDIRRTIQYVNRNARISQKWDFVKEYDGWPLHPGHDPESPYARRLRSH
jgi:REP element-mobilizing transposase RayT